MKYFQETLKLFHNSKYYFTISLGMDGNYTYVSGNYDKNFSFTNESLLGKPFYITLHPDDIKICEEVGGNCIKDPASLFPATLRKHDGKGGYIVTQWELKAILDEENKPAGIFCIGYNVTDHVAAVNSLNEIGFINSHVIRKPLANILGLTSLLNKMEIDADLSNIINMIVESANELDIEIKNISNKTF